MPRSSGWGMKPGRAARGPLANRSTTSLYRSFHTSSTLSITPPPSDDNWACRNPTLRVWMSPSMDRDQMDVEDVEFAERLEAYAEARLSPSLSATSRMRAQVMAAAQRQAALQHADAERAALVAAEAATRPMVLRPPRWRRPLAALLAASLTLALAVGSGAAAHAGGRLFGVPIC